MAESAVLSSREGNILILTLNEPDQRNRMAWPLLDSLDAALSDAMTQEDVRCIVITGKGDTFCGGADLREGFKSQESTAPPNEYAMSLYGSFLKVLDIEVPVIAAMQGHAIGGGLGLAMVADIRVANEEAKYGSNFVKLGIHPGMATTFLLPRFVGIPKAAELLFTGRIVSGAEACSLGLVNHAVASSDVLTVAMEIAREISLNAPIAVRWVKKSLYRHANWSPLSAAEWESHQQSRTFEMNDAREGVAAFLEKRAPEFKGE